MEKQRILYIGAHADDVAINAGVTIHRNPGSSHILTITDGAPHSTYPIQLGGITFNSHKAYVQQRLDEDKAAMNSLGVSVGKRYVNGRIQDRQTHKNIKQIVEIIAALVKAEKIRRIMTHSFPGESHAAHPDHEIVSVCSHIIAQEYGIEVWEYPRFIANSANKQATAMFLEEDKMETVRWDFTPEEVTLKDELMRIYVTQEFIIEKYRTTREMFGRAVRDTKSIPETTHLYGDSEYKPTPRDIRKAITEFFMTATEVGKCKHPTPAG